MQFDSATLQKILSEPDDKLWQMIVMIASMNGIALSKTPPPKEEMTRLRDILSGAEQTDYNDALRMVEKYKRAK